MIERSESATPVSHPEAALKGFWQLVHGPLVHWARTRPDAIALENETQRLCYSDLHAQVLQRSAAIVQQQLPRMVLCDAANGTLATVIEFLAIIHSGRCAAVSDPQWPADVHQRIMQSLPTTPCTVHEAAPDSAFYTGFTSGSTGLPKGFMRHHRSWSESFRVSLADFGAVAGERMLSPGRMSHSLFLFGVMQALWCGSGAIVQEQFSALRCLKTLRDAAVPALVAVPSQLLLMLQWAQQRALPPIDAVLFIMISGARWMRSRTAELQALFPHARIVEFYGASEASFIAWMDADEDAPPQAVGRAFSNVELSIRPTPTDTPGTGLIYMRSPMHFMDYVGEHVDRTGVLRDGDWLSVRDMGCIDARGLLHLVGRQNRMIVTSGKNLFPEELENLLQDHPAIARASVHGVHDALRGMQIQAIVQWHADAATTVDLARVTQWLRARTERFKLPRLWWICHEWPHTSSGKTDHRQLAYMLEQTLAGNAVLQPWNGTP